MQKNKPVRLKGRQLKDYYIYLKENKNCLICGEYFVEIHHHPFGVYRDNKKVVTLCHIHHRGEYSPHGRDSDKFYKETSKKALDKIALENYKEFFNETY